MNLNVSSDMREELKARYSSLTPAEKMMVDQILEEYENEGESPTYKGLREVDFLWEPVDVVQFLEDDYYLGGKLTEQLFPKWREVLYKVLAPEAKTTEWILGGAIGVGKSTVISVAITMLIYRMSCLRNPHDYYKLMPGSNIVFGIYSLTKTQAQDSIYAKIRNFCSESPYFKEKFPFDKKITSRILWRERNISVNTGSKGFHAIGLDMFAFCLDEGNFFKVNKKKNSENSDNTNQAQIIYNGAKTRVVSRFLQAGGTVPGMVFLASSKTHQGAFLEEHTKKSKKDVESGLTELSEFSQWEVRKSSLYTKPRFRVEIGDQLYPPRILPTGEAPRKGAEVIQVPGEFYEEFDRDCDLALRDIAGIATFGLTPLIRDKLSIHRNVTDTIEHPFIRDTFVIDYKDDVGIEQYFLPERLFKIVSSNYTPLYRPGIARFVHVDLGLTGDRAGLAMTHIGRFKKVTRMRGDGTYFYDMQPILTVDFMLGLTPPKDSEIDISKIRTFLISLRDMGMPIMRVTFDGWQSSDSAQLLEKVGFETAKYSVDRTDDAYLALRQAMTEDRIEYYNYGIFLKEMENLERDLDTHKVDHPEKNPDGTIGSKDVADAVAASAYMCLIDPRVNTESAVLDGSNTISDGVGINTSHNPIKWGNLDEEFKMISGRRNG